MAENSHEELQLIDSRRDFLRCGIDYGSDARVLLVKGLDRLVWAKATSTLIGIKGCGHTTTPCTLELRSFKEDGTRIVPGHSKILLQGGRLSRARLLSVAADIDAVFGRGVTEQLDHRRTTVVGRDQIAAWLALERQQEEECQRQSSLHLRQQMEALEAGEYSGLRV